MAKCYIVLLYLLLLVSVQYNGYYFSANVDGVVDVLLVFVFFSSLLQHHGMSVFSLPFGITASPVSSAGLQNWETERM